jgi:hypothetical protein
VVDRGGEMRISVKGDFREMNSSKEIRTDFPVNRVE